MGRHWHREEIAVLYEVAGTYISAIAYLRFNDQIEKLGFPPRTFHSFVYMAKRLKITLRPEYGDSYHLANLAATLNIPCSSICLWVKNSLLECEDTSVYRMVSPSQVRSFAIAYPEKLQGCNLDNLRTIVGELPEEVIRIIENPRKNRQPVKVFDKITKKVYPSLTTASQGTKISIWSIMRMSHRFEINKKRF